MFIKTILVHAEDSAAGRALLEAAHAFAAGQNAHLIALVCGLEPMTPYVGMTAGPIDDYVRALQSAREETDAEVARMEALLARLGGSYEVRGATVPSGFAGEAFARHARYADLAIVPQTNASGTLHRILDAALFGSGRPVLVCPEGASLDAIGRRVAMAWDAGPEAARAIGHALPLIADPSSPANDVRVVIVDPQIAPTRHGEEPGADIAALLARHGLPVTVDTLPDFGERFAPVFLRHAEDVDADLLVAGAYGHARIAQVVLGGATRDLIAETRRPLLMAH